MKIFLIGMPGAGKSTLGRQLANELGVTFLDLDSEIESRQNKSVQQLFAEDGEDHFRITESRILREWLASPIDYVMATGGGAPCYFSGIDAINEVGISLFIDVPVKVLLGRLSKRTDRPLLKTENPVDMESRLENIFREREACYRKSRIVLREPTLSQMMAALRLRK
jgi:shikimate kinase